MTARQRIVSESLAEGETECPDPRPPPGVYLVFCLALRWVLPLHEGLTRLQPQLDAKGVTLTRHFPDSLPVDADSDRINQALTNLVGNALTHTSKGGSVSLRGESDGRVGKVVVSDSGEGIDPGRLDEIFERFTRLDASGAGTGIGLNIARTIARLHGGDITAYSGGPGTGAIFTLSIPRAARV